MTATAQLLELEPGWYEDVSMEAYLAIPALSSSALNLLHRSPAHYRHATSNPKPATSAMQEGTAVHLALLEPEAFADRYIALGRCEAIKKGDLTRCTNQGVVYRDGRSFCGVKGHDPDYGAPTDPDVHVLPAEALERIEGMKAAVLAHPDASQFFRGRGRSEVTGLWRDESTGVLCKIRLDRELERAHIHVDLKSTSDASEDAFARQVGRLGYARKSRFYRRGMEALGKPATASVLIAVESQPPHGCATYLLDEGDLLAFDPQIDGLLARYAECQRTGCWPGYDAGLRHLQLKPWDKPNRGDAASDYDSDFDSEGA